MYRESSKALPIPPLEIGVNTRTDLGSRLFALGGGSPPGVTSKGASFPTGPREHSLFFPKVNRKRKTAREGPSLMAAAVQDSLAASISDEMTRTNTHMLPKRKAHVLNACMPQT